MSGKWTCYRNQESFPSGKTRFISTFTFEVCRITWTHVLDLVTVLNWTHSMQALCCENPFHDWCGSFIGMGFLPITRVYIIFIIFFTSELLPLLHHHVAQVQGSTQDHLQLFNIEQKSKMKSHLMPEQVGTPFRIFIWNLWDCCGGWFSLWDSRSRALMNLLYS